MPRILILHGPNLHALGTREPEVYGRVTLADVETRLTALARELGSEVEFFHSNHEGLLIDALYQARGRFHGVVINPGGLTHTSVALRDAVRGAGLPTVEVHVSNPLTREEFRHTSLISGVALGTVQGFGVDSYLLGLRALHQHLSHGQS
ncbi:MAG: type II 3-dehydroquinate dehydratase [Candidatus Eisenbacteria bacterium]|uniref:3-dehydroquinate dehydratase n=1 Tax=Eiseniibacteriota bacterium TaxID=2212470 RepID=A0A933SHG9_UNCEI|nr:type II 3-dehydroquinate dehydratase [Candidatus Eisenbacteria bacterium]